LKPGYPSLALDAIRAEPATRQQLFNLICRPLGIL
jgi:hypothetical protein